MTRPVVAIGSFDGVHRGHCQILRYLREVAAASGGQSVVVTFDPHPQMLLNPQSDFFTLNSIERNLDLIAGQGVDVAVVIPFTKELSQLSYLDFIEKYIIGILNAHALVMGPNHVIGHNREGNRQKIRGLCLQHRVEVADIPEFMVDNAKVHSSVIRQLIRDGRFDRADELLGYHWEPGRNEE